jgi:hypothetical protein
MNRVIFITVKTYTNSDWLNKKMLQLTLAGQHQLSEGKYPIYVVDRYEDVAQYLDQADWLFVETAGDIVVNRDHLWEKIHNMPEDVGVVGHLMWYPEDRTPHLHEQCFILNTKIFKNCKLDFTSSYTDNGPEFIRGQGDMNNGHAPLSIHISEKIVERDIGFGTKVMEHSLQKGFKVVNFDAEWRYPDFHKDFVSIDDLVDNLDLDKDRFKLASRGFFYPTTGSELFEECLKTLTVSPELEETQRLVISILRKFLAFEYVNIWQWDGNAPHIQADVAISPANGLLGENMALTSNAKKIVFFDINPHNIEFKKDLYSKWDGIDYQKFGEDWARARNLDIEPRLSSAQGGAELLMKDNARVFENWNKIKNLEVEFHCLDLVDNIDKLLSNNKKFFLHTSTIMNYFIITNIRHDQSKIDELRSKIEHYCKTLDGHWLESK